MLLRIVQNTNDRKHSSSSGAILQCHGLQRRTSLPGYFQLDWCRLGGQFLSGWHETGKLLQCLRKGLEKRDEKYGLSRFSLLNIHFAAKSRDNY